jgi:hypothetical protein
VHEIPWLGLLLVPPTVGLCSMTGAGHRTQVASALGRSRLPLGRLVGLLGAVVLVLDQQPQSFGGLGQNAESAGSPCPH